MPYLDDNNDDDDDDLITFHGFIYSIAGYVTGQGIKYSVEAFSINTGVEMTRSHLVD